ncbi:MAG: hypothetical protein GXO56_01000 [Chloroflexi bacterium]|nr:hypothetical protein [Chloroflexota bacterium]
MALEAVSEYGMGTLGRELSVQLAHRALRRLESDPVAAFLWATAEYDLEEAVKALRVLLGDIAIWGGTVRRVWNQDGAPARGMNLVVLGGEDLRIQSARFAQLPSVSEITERLPHWQESVLFVALEAMQPRLNRWLDVLSHNQGGLNGGLVGGGLRVGRPALIGGRDVGEGGMSLLTVQGTHLGLGWGSGWRSTGLWSQVTESRGEWVRALDGRPASQELERLFGQPARRWAYAPLREFTRLYPLGLRTEDGGWDIRAPLHVEADGSLRMTLPVPRGARAYWMVGSMDDAAQAAEDAAAYALRALGKHSPALALVWMDWACSYLFTAHEDAIFQRVRRILGNDVPITGVYTYGQIVAPPQDTPARLLHNHIVVALLAAA